MARDLAAKRRCLLQETDVGEDARTGMCFGVSAMQGWRAQMEDDHLHILSLPEVSRLRYAHCPTSRTLQRPAPAVLLLVGACPSPILLPDLACLLIDAQAPNLALFGVYDGHGGDMVAHYTAKNFKSHLLKNELVSSDRADFAAKTQAAFETALMSIDAELRALPEVETGQDQSGSTSVMTLVSPQHIICANTGDSRAVLCRNGEAVTLSNDHKPYNDEEKTRIEAAGSTVKFNRVNGDLAVSRALGDFVYKRCDRMPAERQAVTAFPEARLPPLSQLPR